MNRTDKSRGIVAGTMALMVGLAVGCNDGPTGPVTGGQLALDTVATGLASPVYLTAPAGDARLFVVEKVGRIRIIENGQLRTAPFLDIAAKVSGGNERGLLSLAFHPQYATNGLFYVDYTDNAGNTKVERYRVSADANVADAGSARSILAVNQPFSNHNGGLVMFGPDGKLYIGLGDGGSAGDPQGNGQNRATLLGSILRIDVDGGDPYAIPAGNPFVGQAGARPEIWAFGLRNPWRFAFDETAGLIYIADVGQNAWEEVNVVRTDAAGLNYGWRIREGAHCYNASTCATAGLTDPVLEYGHSPECSITGGFVYRGTRVPELSGHYVYADYCAGWIRSFRYDGAVTSETDWSLGAGNVQSFGRDGSGELYVMNSAGSVMRIVSR